MENINKFITFILGIIFVSILAFILFNNARKQPTTTEAKNVKTVSITPTAVINKDGKKPETFLEMIAGKFNQQSTGATAAATTKAVSVSSSQNIALELATGKKEGGGIEPQGATIVEYKNTTNTIPKTGPSEVVTFLLVVGAAGSQFLRKFRG
jgi:hypothetical protein